MATCTMPAALRLNTPRFLAGLDDRDVECVVASAVLRRFPAGSVITSQGGPAEHLHLLQTGRARFFYLTHSGQKILLRWFVPGEMFGGAAVLEAPSCYVVSTEAVRDSAVWSWDRKTIRRLAREYPRLIENTLSIAADYLSLYVSAHVALVCNDARRRVAELLLNLASTIGQPSGQGFALDITNEELANAANVTLFTASRFLAEWQRRGVLTKGRGKLLLRHPERLVLASPE